MISYNIGLFSVLYIKGLKSLSKFGTINISIDKIYERRLLRTAV